MLLGFSHRLWKDLSRRAQPHSSVTTVGRCAEQDWGGEEKRIRNKLGSRDSEASREPPCGTVLMAGVSLAPRLGCLVYVLPS